MKQVYSSTLSFPLLLGSEVRAVEIDYCKQQKIPTYTLMQRAGLSLWKLIEKKFPNDKKIVVITGPGNNGGDGFEVAVHALKAGKNVKVRFVSTEKNTEGYLNSISGDAAIALKNLQRESVEISSLEENDCQQAELIIDALLGTGIKAPAREEFNQAIKQINNSKAKVLSVDVPSGLDADCGCKVGVVVKANLTLSFIALKPGLVTAIGKEYCGELLFDDLAVEQIKDFMQQDRSLTSLLNKNTKMLPRELNSHKGDHGRTLIIGGNLGMGGAAMLAASAACRAGSGAVMMITRPEHVSAVLAQSPEVMVIGTDSGEDSKAGELALKALNSATAIVVGPGLGNDAWAEFWLRKALSMDVKKVVDADGLRLASKLKLSLEGTIITPHPGEASALLERSRGSVFKSIEDIQNDRYGAAIALQQVTKATVVLKGAGTIIINSNDSGKLSVRVCPYGNPGMATAGMGDILAGILGALLSQKIARQKAAVIGTLMHSLAGDRAAAGKPIGLLASDLLTEIRQIRNEI